MPGAYERGGILIGWAPYVRDDDVRYIVETIKGAIDR